MVVKGTAEDEFMAIRKKLRKMSINTTVLFLIFFGTQR